MASVDGEAEQPSEQVRQHLSSCGSCRAWLTDLESLSGELRGLAYADSARDLWPGVEGRIRRRDAGPVSGRLVAIAVLVLAWRGLQLFVDVPLPMLHPLVPLAAVVAAVWHLAGDPLAIETFAPELRSEASDGIA
jgi:predicted anti-sigma-YlaC factor YlaD